MCIIAFDLILILILSLPLALSRVLFLCSILIVSAIFNWFAYLRVWAFDKIIGKNERTSHQLEVDACVCERVRVRLCEHSNAISMTHRRLKNAFFFFHFIHSAFLGGRSHHKSSFKNDDIRDIMLFKRWPHKNVRQVCSRNGNENERIQFRKRDNKQFYVS